MKIRAGSTGGRSTGQVRRIFAIDWGIEALSAQNSVLVTIARPYASALFDLASDANDIAGVEKALDSLLKLVNDSTDFSVFLKSPVISGDDKSAVVEALIKKAKLKGLTANFLNLVAKNQRLFALPQMISQFKALAAKDRGEVHAEVTSAQPLSKAHQDSLAKALKEKIGKDVTLEQHVDADLIGGLIVKVGSQMIDSSLKTKLTAMKIAMKEVG